MPALITHRLFGERSLDLIEGKPIGGDEERAAFLLGNQGPDPFFFSYLGRPKATACARDLGERMHEQSMTHAFLALHNGVDGLPFADRTLGRAFALGVLSHYALDRAAHPLVFAQQHAICAADPALAHAGGKVHAVIESDLDVWLLWREKAETVATFVPAGVLARTRRIEQVAGALFAQAADEAFGLPVGEGAYGEAVRTMERVYRLIEPEDSTRSRRVSAVERRLARLVAHGKAKQDARYSLFKALAHRAVPLEECEFANSDHEPWTDPFTQAESTDSFHDRIEGALAGWPALAAAWDSGRSDLMREAVRRLNYSGCPLDEDEIAQACS